MRNAGGGGAHSEGDNIWLKNQMLVLVGGPKIGGDKRDAQFWKNHSQTEHILQITVYCMKKSVLYMEPPTDTNRKRIPQLPGQCIG